MDNLSITLASDRQDHFEVITCYLLEMTKKKNHGNFQDIKAFIWWPSLFHFKVKVTPS